MLSHSNAFIPMMNDEERQCFDDYADQHFTIELQITVRPDALHASDINDLEDRIHNLIFSHNSYGCISLDRSADFNLSVKSAQNELLYQNRYQRCKVMPDIIWDERELWRDLKDEYLIELALDERCSKTLDFWYWLEESNAGFWSDVEMKGFLHCGIDDAVAACFRKGCGHKDVFVTTLDLPSENGNWFEGTFEGDSMTADWFSMSIDVYNQNLWEKIVPPAMEIAAVNQAKYADKSTHTVKSTHDDKPTQDDRAAYDSQFLGERNLSLLEKVTDECSPEKAAARFADQRIRFYPAIEVGAGSKYLLEKSIRQILLLLSKTEASFYTAHTHTGFFYNRKSLYLEIWDYNPDTFELVISHTKPLN